MLLPSQEAMWAAWVLNPRLPVLLPRHLLLVLSRQVPPRSSRNSSPIRGENTPEHTKHYCVINLSSKPLTQAHMSLLAKEPNYVVTPRHPPILEYITAIESVCTKLGQQEAEGLRADINRALRSSHPLNLT